MSMSVTNHEIIPRALARIGAVENYGRGPGMDALQDLRALNALPEEERAAGAARYVERKIIQRQHELAAINEPPARPALTLADIEAAAARIYRSYMIPPHLLVASGWLSLRAIDNAAGLVPLPPREPEPREIAPFPLAAYRALTE